MIDKDNNMQNPDLEPIVKQWDRVVDDELETRFREHLNDDDYYLILVDGRSGSGKTFFASKVVKMLDAALVHIDDVSWHLDPVNWVDELQAGVIEPWLDGQDIAFKPPGWTKMGRDGQIEAPHKPILVLEGVGAGRHELTSQADLVVWVQSDEAKARKNALDNAMDEFNNVCSTSIDCKNYAKTVEPMRTDCSFKNGSYKC